MVKEHAQITPTGGINPFFRMQSNVIANAYGKSTYEVDADPSTLTFSKIATMVNYYTLPWQVTGRNGIISPDMDLCAAGNDMVGCYEYNARGSSTQQIIS